MVQDPAASPKKRLILLGASNLTRGFASMLETATRLLGEPLDVLAAAGHGRSYGAVSRVLIRSLPGILQCGLWSDLDARPPLPARAIITDIGNDLFYGASPDQIAGWVATCIDRLEQAGAVVTVARLPLCNLPRVSPRGYQLLVRVMFPRCRMSFETANRHACELDALVHELAQRRGLATVEPLAEWYGLDPLHVRLRNASRAWQATLSAGQSLDSLPPPVSVPPALHIRSALIVPQQRWILGFEQRRKQPAWIWPSGTRVSMY